MTVPKASENIHGTKDKGKSSKSRRMVLAWLISALVVIDIVLYFIYAAGVEKPTLWEYLGSEPFKLGTVGLLIPIFVAYANERFQISKSIRERIQKTQDAAHDRRIQCIKMTSNMWNKLFELAAEVRYAEDMTGVANLIKNLEFTCNAGERTISLLYLYFPRFVKNNINLFVSILNFMLDSAASTAYNLIEDLTPSKDQQNKTEITKHRNELELIQNLINNTLRYPFLETLHLADEEITTGQTPEDLEKNLTRMKEWISHFEQIIVANSQFPLPSGSDFNQSANAVKIPYSPECVHRLAEWALSELVKMKLKKQDELKEKQGKVKDEPEGEVK